MPIPELRNMVVVDGENVPHLETMESRGRTNHVHWDGCEVQRQFYINHYRAAPDVCAALLGFVLRETTQAGGLVYRRYLPAFDPYYNQILFCNEARWDHVDQKAISNSTPLAATAEGLEQTAAYHRFMAGASVVPERAEGGAFITASYRPLISAYTVSNRDRQFDYMDPILTPGVSTIPWPDGLQIVKDGRILGINADTLSQEAADPIAIPLIEFTVRRMFLGKIPYVTWNIHLNKVNYLPWPSVPAGEGWPWTIPQFPAETLRFDSYKVTSHWSQSSTLNLWYEVEFHFSWRSYVDYPVFGLNGENLGRQWVTWNHVFINPLDADLGWYRVIRKDERAPIHEVHGENLYGRSDFDLLFRPVTPASQ